jgi:hypothetical protein
MNRNRIFATGCLGAIALIIALVAVTIFSLRGAFESARSRWEQKGSPDYTLVVEQYCFCMQVGSYKITVQSGQVTAVDLVTDVGSPFGMPSIAPKPADFDRLAVTAMLARAERDQADMWTVPWTHQLQIIYDPIYGYVTDYNSDANGEWDRLTGRMITDSGYSYKAHDLVITQP